MPLDPSWNGVKKILCIRLDSLGDVLMTTPAIRALKESFPTSQITLLTSPSGAAAASLVPEIDELLVYEAPWMKATPLREDSRPEYTLVAQLKQAGYDAAVIFTVFSQNPLPAAFLTYLAGIPRRLAYSRENPYQLLTHWLKDPDTGERMRHEVRRQLDLVESIGCQSSDERLSLQVPSKAYWRVQGILNGLGINTEQPWLAIHPGATAPSRRYPPESYARAARILIDQGIQVVFTGSESERELIAEIQAGVGGPSFSLAGDLDLAGLAALIAQAPLLITNNTGPAHIAAAVQTPVVDLYALTNPQHTPWKVAQRVLNYDVPCKFCYKSVCPEGHNNCLRMITPEQVAGAALELLSEYSAFRIPFQLLGGIEQEIV